MSHEIKKTFQLVSRKFIFNVNSALPCSMTIFFLESKSLVFSFKPKPPLKFVPSLDDKSAASQGCRRLPVPPSEKCGCRKNHIFYIFWRGGIVQWQGYILEEPPLRRDMIKGIYFTCTRGTSQTGDLWMAWDQLQDQFDGEMPSGGDHHSSTW